MKKKLVILAMILLLIGCGKKGPKKEELTCTKTISDSKSSVVYELTYNYEDDKLISVSSDTALTFTSEGVSNLETFKTYAESSKDEYNKKAGVKATLDINNNVINIVVKYDISKMNDDEIENNLFNKNINDTRENNEKEGYTCK